MIIEIEYRQADNYKILPDLTCSLSSDKSNDKSKIKFDIKFVLEEYVIKIIYQKLWYRCNCDPQGLE